MRFEQLTVEADCFIGDRALPTLSNAARNIGENMLGCFGLGMAEKTKLTILREVSGILKPSRYFTILILTKYCHILKLRTLTYISPSVLGYYLNCDRMTLLLGPPSSGKTTLLLALAGKLDPTLKVASH